MNLEPVHRARLLQVARRAIIQGILEPGPGGAPAAGAAPPLGRPAASFVTLSVDGQLRGCCGSIEAHQPLLTDVWHNARRSAFADPRFAPLTGPEVDACRLEVSVLGEVVPMGVDGEQALLAGLRPGLDGLLVCLGERRATFLPKVWQTLPEPGQFVGHLKRKLGVPVDFWDPALRFARYRTDEFGGALREPPAGGPG